MLRRPDRPAAEVTERRSALTSDRPDARMPRRHAVRPGAGEDERKPGRTHGDPPECVPGRNTAGPTGRRNAGATVRQGAPVLVCRSAPKDARLRACQNGRKQNRTPVCHTVRRHAGTDAEATG